jgi:hypothetical protein
MFACTLRHNNSSTNNNTAAEQMAAACSNATIIGKIAADVAMFAG